MRNIVAKFGLACATAALLAAPAADARTRMTPEQQLAKILKDRVPGKPVDCIWLPLVNNTVVIDKTAIVYDAGRTIYVNRPRMGADSLDDDDIMVTRLWGSQLCSLDPVQMHDRVSGMWSGFVSLGKFVPYTRPKAAKAED